jgi:alpha 1,3-glucosidase
MESREVHSLYGIANAAATHTAMLTKFPRRRPFVLTRSFFAGCQKFAWHWSGDDRPSDLRQSLQTQLASNMAGLPFSGSDIGGFNAETNLWVLARCFQLAAYVFCREHNDIHTAPREPWVYEKSNPEQFVAMRNAIIDRYKMLPMLYTAARDACEVGRPFAPPVWFEFRTAKRWTGRLALAVKRWLCRNSTETEVVVAKPPGRWFEL